MDKRNQEIVVFQTQRAFSALCKNFLYILEGLKKEHEFNFTKLKNALPPEYHSLLTQAEFLDASRYSYLRKLILDRGGDANREITQELLKYNIQLKRDEGEL